MRYLLVALLLGGCNYVPRTEFTVKTVDGKEITLACPFVDRARSEWTYVIEGQCIGVKK